MKKAASPDADRAEYQTAATTRMSFAIDTVVDAEEEGDDAAYTFRDDRSVEGGTMRPRWNVEEEGERSVSVPSAVSVGMGVMDEGDEGGDVMRLGPLPLTGTSETRLASPSLSSSLRISHRTLPANSCPSV